jgi:hypothetical protein
MRSTVLWLIVCKRGMRLSVSVTSTIAELRSTEQSIASRCGTFVDRTCSPMIQAILGQQIQRIRFAVILCAGTSPDWDWNGFARWYGLFLSEAMSRSVYERIWTVRGHTWRAVDPFIGLSGKYALCFSLIPFDGMAGLGAHGDQIRPRPWASVDSHLLSLDFPTLTMRSGCSNGFLSPCWRFLSKYSAATFA